MNNETKKQTIDLYGQTKTIIINGKEVIIKKLVLGKYALIMKAFKKLPEKLGSFGAISNEKIISVLPSMIADSLPEVIEILSIATDVPAKELEDTYGLDDITEVIKAIFEINNFEIVKKNMESLWKTAKTSQNQNIAG